MSRALFAVMAGLLCTLAGFRHASALKGEAVRLKRWGQLLEHLALLLQECTLSLPQALGQAANGSAAPDNLLRALAGSLQAKPLVPLPDAFNALMEDCTEKPALSRMFARLSHGTLESRVQAVQQTAREMDLLQTQAAQKAEKDARLYQTLGLTGGICLTILLL